MNTQPDQELNSTTWISVPNPDDRFGMPIFEGLVSDAAARLTPGVYAAVTDGDVDCELTVTARDAHIEAGGPGSSDTQWFWRMEQVLQDVRSAGVAAVMEHMGGGNYAIATGHYDSERAAFTGVLVGPVFQRTDGTYVSHREECYVGPDNTEIQGATVPPTITQRDLARMIVKAHNKQVTSEQEQR